MKLIDSDKLADLASRLAASGLRVVAPIEVDGLVRLAEWTGGAKIRTDAVPVNSAKDFLLPRSEVVARFKLDGADFAPLPVEPSAAKTVLLAVRPCDAAAVAALDAVFNWDYRDEFYNARRAATTIVTLACAAADEQCFCTSVGGRPDGAAGADAVLRPAGGGRQLILEPLSDKGRDIVAAAGAALADGDAAPDAPADVPVRFDQPAVAKWLDANFDSPLWEQFSLPCLGCGSCAYACPACHCFDMQDETTRGECRRYRCWDTCGQGLFTLHASGHNPRASQAARWRQRVLHKLSYYPARFGMASCTGCGRCARLCQAALGILDVCRRIDQLRSTP